MAAGAVDISAPTGAHKMQAKGRESRYAGSGPIGPKPEHRAADDAASALPFFEAEAKKLRANWP
jgi:hypothetical protein